MQGWLGVVEILVLVALCLALPLALLAGRRRWLARLGGTFECSLRLRTGSRTGGWSLGESDATTKRFSNGSGSSPSPYGRGSRSFAAMCG